MIKQACGHPPCCIEGRLEGTQWCGWCADVVRVVEAEREACCKDICRSCERGLTVIHESDPSLGWWHDADNPHGLVECEAAAIRARGEGKR